MTSRLLISSTENTDICELRRELSLDLEKSKMSVDDASLSSNKQNINISSASNTPNFTHTSGSTSQSMTPSEFGYHHLNRQSNVVSLDGSPKSDMLENLEQAFKNYEHSATTPILTIPTTKAKSPIKSTINITYNLKSPMRNTQQENFLFPSSDSEMGRDSNQFYDYETINVAGNDKPPSNLLETSFDENMVYEQLKFFKGAVSDVNYLLDNGNDEQRSTSNPVCAETELSDSLNVTSQIVPNISANAKKQNDGNACSVNAPSIIRVTANETNNEDKSDSDDVLMPEQELDIQDSLEYDQNISMYENVNLRKPKCVYENIDMRLNNKTKLINGHDGSESITTVGKENSKPANFSVRQLANKFETSPVDAMPPFDFSKPFARKTCDTRNSSSSAKTKNTPQQLNRTSKFTRSLDENAFVREFGSTRVHEKVNKSTHQIPAVANVLTENSPSRRLSMECTRLKSLNPPKRLPNLTDSEICKVDTSMKLELSNAENLVIQNFDVKITPTTENPISLIQHNVSMEQTEDERNSTNSTNTKVLGSFKLDRERIEKIKEERRHQLNEKFRSESFKCEKDGNKVKSKSKIELNELKDSDKKISDSLQLQYKSKSRNEIYNKKDADISIVLAQSHSGTGLAPRVRRISDEKNQNDCVEVVVVDKTKVDVLTKCAEEQNVSLKTRKFDRRSIDLKREQEHFTKPGSMQQRPPHTQ